MKGVTVVSKVKLSMDAGKAIPGPRIASVLGPRGIPIPKFCEAFNKMTSDSNKYKTGDSIIVRVVVYDNKSYDLIINDAPSVSNLLKQAICLIKGASNPGKEVVSKINKSILVDIARRKMSDMKVNELMSALKMVIGTARSMGIEIEDIEDSEKN